MANFLLVVGASDARERAARLYRQGVELMRRHKGHAPSGSADGGTVLAASFARLNGTGTPLVQDPASGNWLIAVGTWFHEAGYGSGQERRLLERCNQVGVDRLAREVEGFYALVSFDARERVATVVTDVCGTLHCYLRTLGDMVAVSNSSLVLAALGDATLDPVGCQEFLQTGAMYEDRTLFREVRKLEAATCFRFADGALRERRPYWRVTELAPNSLDGEASVAAMREAVLAGARKIAAVFPRPEVDLTAGYDSRAGVAAFLSAGVPFETAVAGEPGSPDVVIAETLARGAGLRHRHFRAQPVARFEELRAALALTDGEYDLVDYARIQQVQSDLAQRFDISVNSYSGEIGRGYGWELLRPHTGQVRPLDAAKVGPRRFFNPSFDPSIIDPAQRIDPHAHYRDVVARIDAGLHDLPNTLQYDYTMTMLRCQRWYGRIATSTNQIVPCMSFFLLLSIIKPMLEANTRSRRRSLLFRRLIAELQPEMARQPLDKGYPAMPATLASLPRFWPIVPLYGGKVLDRLKRKLLPAPPAPAEPPESPRRRLWQDEAVQDTLQPGRLLSAALFDAQAVARFIEQSRAPSFGRTGQWALVLSLEMALRRLQELREGLRSAT